MPLAKLSPNHSSRVATAAAAAAAGEAATTMAAFRRVSALAVKLNLWTAARYEFVGGRTASGGRARKCLAAGMCVATGGAVALYLYNDMISSRSRKRGSRSINCLLPSIPTVEAKEKVCVVLNWHFTGNSEGLVRRSDLLGRKCLGVRDAWNDRQTAGGRADSVCFPSLCQAPSAKLRVRAAVGRAYFCFVAMVIYFLSAG